MTKALYLLIDTSALGDFVQWRWWLPNFGTTLKLSRCWFQIFSMVNPTWGNDPFWRAYVSNGLAQPPTSDSLDWEWSLVGVYIYIYIGVSKSSGTPTWMVYNGKPYYNGWFGGTTIFGNIHIYIYIPIIRIPTKGGMTIISLFTRLSVPQITRSLDTLRIKSGSESRQLGHLGRHRNKKDWENMSGMDIFFQNVVWIFPSLVW